MSNKRPNEDSKEVGQNKKHKHASSRRSECSPVLNKYEMMTTILEKLEMKHVMLVNEDPNSIVNEVRLTQLTINFMQDKVDRLNSNLKHDDPVWLKGYTLTRPEVEEQFKLECKIHQRLVHPNVVRLYVFINSPGTCTCSEVPNPKHAKFGYLILEPLGPTLGIWKSTFEVEFLTFSEFLQVFRQVGSAVAYLHDHNTIHGNISLATVAFQHGKTLARNSLEILKLFDFSTAREGNANDYLTAHEQSRTILDPNEVPKALVRPTNVFMLEAIQFAAFLSTVTPLDSWIRSEGLLGEVLGCLTGVPTTCITVQTALRHLEPLFSSLLEKKPADHQPNTTEPPPNLESFPELLDEHGKMRPEVQRLYNLPPEDFRTWLEEQSGIHPNSTLQKQKFVEKLLKLSPEDFQKWIRQQQALLRKKQKSLSLKTRPTVAAKKQKSLLIKTCQPVLTTLIERVTDEPPEDFESWLKKQQERDLARRRAHATRIDQGHSQPGPSHQQPTPGPSQPGPSQQPTPGPSQPGPSQQPTPGPSQPGPSQQPTPVTLQPQCSDQTMSEEEITSTIISKLNAYNFTTDLRLQSRQMYNKFKFHVRLLSATLEAFVANPPRELSYWPDYFRCTNLQAFEGHMVTVKVFRVFTDNKNNMPLLFALFYSELAVTSAIGSGGYHRNIASCLWGFQGCSCTTQDVHDSTHPGQQWLGFLVIECPGPSLESYTKKYPEPFAGELVERLFLQLTSALAFLHRLSIVYNDFNFDSVMVCFDKQYDEHNMPRMKPTNSFKLTNFDCAQFVNDPNQFTLAESHVSHCERHKDAPTNGPWRDNVYLKEANAFAIFVTKVALIGSTRPPSHWEDEIRRAACIRHQDILLQLLQAKTSIVKVDTILNVQYN